MRNIVRGLVAAVALSLAPVAVVATAAAPSNAAVSVETVDARPAAAQQQRAAKKMRSMVVSSVSGKKQPTADVKVTPKFGKKLLLIQKKKGKNYKTFKKVRTNKFGKVRISLAGSRKGIKYQLVAPGNKKFKVLKRVIVAQVF